VLIAEHLKIVVLQRGSGREGGIKRSKLIYFGPTLAIFHGQETKAIFGMQKSLLRGLYNLLLQVTKSKTSKSLKSSRVLTSRNLQDDFNGVKISTAHDCRSIRSYPSKNSRPWIYGDSTRQ